MKIQIHNDLFAFGCCYACNTDDTTLLERFFADLERVKVDYYIIGGDFNTILNKADIKGGRDCTHPNCTKYILEQIENLNLADIWRINHPDTFRFTWSRMKPHPIMERIDYILISYHLAQFVKISDIYPSYLSDHSMPVVYLKLDDELDRGKGRWMFNTAHSNDPEYIAQVKQIITEINNEQKETFLRWEMIKMTIRGYTIQYGTRKKKARSLQLEALEKKLHDLEVNSSKSTELFRDNYKQTLLFKKTIEEIRSYKTRGAILRSRSQWVEHGEKSSKLFFNLEKYKGQKKSIQKLESEQQELLETNTQILDEIYGYYSKLFAKQHTDADSDFLHGLQIPQVLEDEKTC